MRYYIIFLTEATVFRTDDPRIAEKYKNTEYCMTIDTKLNRSFTFEDSNKEIKVRN
jgi:hypothetical protein